MLGVGIAVGAVGAHLLALRFWQKIKLQDQVLVLECSDTEVIFFPDQRFEWGSGDKIGGGMERILSTLSEAEKSLDLALFSFSNRRLAREVINCMNRGVKVRIVTDISQMEDQLGSQVGKNKDVLEQKIVNLTKLLLGETHEGGWGVHCCQPEGRFDAPQICHH